MWPRHWVMAFACTLMVLSGCRELATSPDAEGSTFGNHRQEEQSMPQVDRAETNPARPSSATHQPISTRIAPGGTSTIIRQQSKRMAPPAEPAETSSGHAPDVAQKVEPDGHPPHDTPATGPSRPETAPRRDPASPSRGTTQTTPTETVSDSPGTTGYPLSVKITAGVLGGLAILGLLAILGSGSEQPASTSGTQTPAVTREMPPAAPRPQTRQTYVVDQFGRLVRSPRQV